MSDDGILLRGRGLRPLRPRELVCALFIHGCFSFFRWGTFPARGRPYGRGTGGQIARAAGGGQRLS